MSKTLQPWLGTLATNGLILICGFATGVLTARLLAPESRGALATVLFWPQLLAGIGIFSLPEAVSLRVSQLGTLSKSMVSTSLWVSLLLALLTVSIGWACLPALLTDIHRNLVGLTQVCLLFLVPLNFVTMILLGVEQGSWRIGSYNIVRLSVPLTYLVALLYLSYAGEASVRTTAFASILSNVIVALFALIRGRRYLSFQPRITDAVALSRSAASFHLSAILFLIGNQCDRLFVVLFLDDYAMGIYTVATTLAQSGLGAIAGCFQSLLFPSVAAMPDEASRRACLKRGLQYASLLTFLAAGILAMTAPVIVHKVFGPSFSDAGPLAALSGVAYVPSVLRQIIIRGLRGLERSIPGSIAEATALSVFLVCASFLVHSLGLIGISIASFIGNTIALIYCAYYLRNELEISPGQWSGLHPKVLRRTFTSGWNMVFSHVSSEARP
jgi:O-antigen/teichoic acid export membrane protein